MGDRRAGDYWAHVLTKKMRDARVLLSLVPTWVSSTYGSLFSGIGSLGKRIYARRPDRGRPNSSGGVQDRTRPDLKPINNSLTSN